MAENGPGNPPDTPKVEDLARRIMDLWQEQMAAIAADPDLMRQMARMMAASPFPAMMQGVVAGMMAATQMGPRGPEAAQAGLGGANPYEWWKGANGPSKQPASPQAGPAPAAAASQPGGGDLDELRRNLAGLEARLKQLGAEPAKPKSKRKPAAKVGDAVRGSGKSGSGGAGGGAAG
ncbi:MAG: hypothetical protein ABUL54_05290 [Dongia sp.]|jgi:hypothetical protein